MDSLGMGPSKGVALRYSSAPEHNTEDCLYCCPLCQSTFFGGGRAMHLLASCAANGYVGCHLLITPAFLAEVKRRAALHGDDFPHWGVSLNMLRESLPDIVESGSTTANVE